MATTDQLEALKRAMSFTAADDEAYPDNLLAAVIDAAGSVDAAAARLWREKAAATAGLVNVTEAGSSRSLGNLSAQAAAMAKMYEDAAARQGETPVGRTRVSGIERT